MMGYSPRPELARALSIARVHARANQVAQKARFEAERCRRFASRLSNGDLRNALKDRADELTELAENIET
jgi:hypothetical protein